MLLDVILTAVVLGSGLGLIAFIGRKLAIVSSIDVERVPIHRATQLKGQLVEERFRRHLDAASRAVRRLLAPALAIVRRQGGRLAAKLRSLEDRYQLPGGTAQPDEARLAKITQLLNEARTYLEDGQLVEAEAKCIEAISLHQFEVSAYRLLGEIYRQQKDYAHAREVYEFLLELNAQDPEAHVGLGRLAADQGEFAAAQTEFAKSLELNDTASIHLELSDVYTRLGDSAKALTACQEALTLDPRNPKILDRFLTLAIEAGQQELAQDAFGALKAVNPENQKLPVFAEQLEKLGAQR